MIYVSPEKLFEGQIMGVVDMKNYILNYDGSAATDMLQVENPHASCHQLSYIQLLLKVVVLWKDFIDIYVSAYL